MPQLRLSQDQIDIISAPLTEKIFLEGPAGSGKTTIGVERMLNLLDLQIPAEQILILIPQRTLAEPYYRALHNPNLPAGGNVSIMTVGGLAQRSIELFWPLISKSSGFARPKDPPHFLTLETAQYYMARLVAPLLEKGYFETITIDRSRLLSQILDNLNKSAAVGFAYTDLAARLKSAWKGEPAQLHAFDEAQEAANLFRKYCLENNLLDFSLQLEVFRQHLWPSFLFRAYLHSTFRHLIFDNIEEDTPLAHDLIADWIPDFDSALLIYDTQAGYRSFLGADQEGAYLLKSTCSQSAEFAGSWVNPPEIESLIATFQQTFARQFDLPPSKRIQSVLAMVHHQFVPETSQWVAQEVLHQIEHASIPPGEIVIISPFLSDSLRFSLTNELERVGIPTRSHRPSRSLRDEPTTQAWLTLAKLAHPNWKLTCARAEVREMLMQTVAPGDLVRADLLAQILYSPARPEQGLGSFGRINAEMQSRITYQLGENFETLRGWLEKYRNGEPVELDVFISRLFGEILSQPGFGFYLHFDAATVTARLIESIRKFRWAASQASSPDGRSVNEEYVHMVDQGIIAAQSLQSWTVQDENAVLLAPAYTYLMTNRPTDIQFWLDIGSSGWWERLYQPLTHPVVLSRHWQPDRVWSDADEYAANQESLNRLITGLLRRCRRKVYLCYTGVNERGEEQRGMLLQAAQSILRRLNRAEEVDDA